MIKRISLFFLFIVLVSCFHRKNEYKKVRFNSVGLSPYKEKMILEDSSNIFNGYYKLEKPINFDEKHEYAGVRKNYLVFYDNGRVARFLDYDEENFDFNPKKAEMGYYGIKGEKKIIKFKVFFQGVYEIIEKEIVVINKDSVITFTPSISGIKNEGFISKYIKVYPKKGIEKFKPDW